MKNKKNDNNLFSKLIVISIIALNVLFTIGIFILFWHTSNEPGILVGSWFAFTTGELWALAKIKTNKKDK